MVFFARSDWLLKLELSSAIQTRVSYEQNGFPVCCRNKQRNFINKRRSCSRKKRRRRQNPVWHRYLSMTPVKVKEVSCLQM